MPTIYLSPSTQEFNPYINGGSEEEFMNLVADSMIPYLDASNISYKRNTPNMTAASSITESNKGNYDLHLSLHSNASPESMQGERQGLDIYYYPSSVKGKEAAQILENTLKKIYLNPNNTKIIPTTSLGEISKTKAPAVLIEYAYHDNAEDASWIKNNIKLIAQQTVKGLTEYFNIPFIDPYAIMFGEIVTKETPLNIRSEPSLNAPIINQVEKGTIVEIIGETENWYILNNGYINKKYVEIV